MASSANGSVKITTEIETAGLQESLNRLESIFNSFAANLKETARKTGKEVDRGLSETDKTTKALENLSNATKKLGTQLKTLGVAAVGLAGSFAGIVKSAISTADRVDELSKRLGISVQSFSRLDYVASQSGTSVEAFGTAMRMIAQNINTGSDAYEKLGVSVKDANGQLKTQDQILLETIKALQKMPAGTAKSAAALKALGRQSMQLNEILNMTADDFEALMKRSDELGLTLNTSITEPAQRIADKFTDLGRTFKMSLVNAITPMIPAIEKITDKFIAMLQPGGELAEAFKNIAQAGLSVVENVFPALIKGLSWVVQHGPEVIAVFTAIKVTLQALTGNWVGAIATGLMGIFSATLLKRATDTKKSIDNVTDSLKKLGVEVNRQGGMSGVVEVSGNLEEMTAKLEQAQKELKEYETALALLEFDETIKNSKELADKQDELKSKILTARTTIDKYAESIKRLNERQEAEGGTADNLEEETDAFKGWSDAVDEAERNLKKFIAEKARAMGGRFDVTKLTAADLVDFKNLKAVLNDAKTDLQTLADAVADTKEEIAKTDAFGKWTDALNSAEDELKDFIALQAELAGGEFNLEILSDADLQKFEELKANVAQTRKALDSLTDAMKEQKEEVVEETEVVEEERDAFADWTDAVDVAEQKLKEFVQAHSTLEGGFNIESLSDEDLAQYDELKAKLTDAKDALNSLNGALEDTKEELVETDAFNKWTTAVNEANDALKDFIATKAEEYGTFDVEKLTDDERKQFEKLRETVKQAKAELQQLQDATDTSTKEVESNLANVSNVIAQAWANVGLAFGNGIEGVAEIIASGTGTLSDVMSGLASTMADSLSAIGDALIQAGIAKMVADQLAEINPAYAIAMGMAIKVAAGAIKGMIARMGKAGSFANGGIVGGSSYSGDRMSANVNSGEMIINRKQQAALWDFIRNGSGGGAGSSPNIEIINNAGANIQTETNPDGRSLRILVNQQIERFLGSPAGSRVMMNTYGTRQLGRR